MQQREMPRTGVLKASLQETAENYLQVAPIRSGGSVIANYEDFLIKTEWLYTPIPGLASRRSKLGGTTVILSSLMQAVCIGDFFMKGRKPMKQIRNWKESPSGISRCRLAEIMKTLTQDVTMTRRDFLLSVLAGILGGIILGMLISPRKYMHIGCNNGNVYDLPQEKQKNKSE